MSEGRDETPVVRRRGGICAATALAAATFVVALLPLAAAPLSTIAGMDFWALLQRAGEQKHPLARVVARVASGEAGVQPAWKLPMLANGLRKQPLTCTITAYCERCPDGGGRLTRWGSPIRRGEVAADPRYWGPGSVVWIGDPINETLVVEDTGSAIKGPHRFDVCVTGNHSLCRTIGIRRSVTYVPLYRTRPQSRWGHKPKGWHPPVWLPEE
ncbi:MAG: 3D domain-containing protein [Armatimonadota bacterium]